MTAPNGPNPPNPPNPPNSPNSPYKTDPTSLTTDQLLREITNLTTIFDAKIDMLKGEIEGDRNLIDARFHAVAQSFENVKERHDITEKQRVEQKADTEKAIQAALLAQKEAFKEQAAAFSLATSKSETGVKEQSSQQYATITAQLTAITDKVAVLTNRVGTIEASKLGAVEQRVEAQTNRGEQRQQQGSSIAVIGGAVGGFGLIISLVMLIVVLMRMG